jgi:hypothetical protein
MNYKSISIGIIWATLLACSSKECQFPLNGDPTTAPSVQYHPIDQLHEVCLNDPDYAITQGIVACHFAALERWQLRMNQLTKEISEELPDSLAIEFQRSQTAWQNYQVQELHFFADYYADSTGTMYFPKRVAVELELIRERVLWLEKSIQLCNEVIALPFKNTVP